VVGFVVGAFTLIVLGMGGPIALDGKTEEF